MQQMPDKTRHNAILAARSHVERLPVYLDTETTGTDYNDGIVEIAIADHDGIALLETLVRPHRRIPAAATAIHGITDEMVREALGWPDVWPRVQALLRGRHVGIYNADFDLKMLQQSHRHARMQWQPIGATQFCIMKLYADFRNEPGPYGTPRWHKLEDAARQCRIALPTAHRALADALLARAVLLYVAQADG
jgi:DNA polymerase-3 subunit epsilon